MTRLFAETRWSWLSTLSPAGWIVVAAICASVWLVLRLGWGRSIARGQWGLLALRAVTIAFAIGIVLGPTIIDEQPGDSTRPTLFYLLDGSQSMQLGGEATRWQESLNFISGAEKSVGAAVASHCKAYRFGHRLMPFSAVEKGDATSSEFDENQVVGNVIAPPDATDSRLADALRQLSSQVDPANNAGLVLLSDGRVRATESVERMAEHFGKTGIPIHVVPVGELEGTGDVAIVSLVVEPRLRKFTENQITLFLRSFGFNGERTVVRVISRSRIASADDVTLAELPISLSGGAQSVSLTFRVEDRPEDLTVVVEPLKGELTDRNNQIQTQVEIDRTKLRVLYIEGEAAGQTSLLGSIFGGVFGRSTASPAPSRAMNIRDALQADEDIECTVLIRQGSGPITRLSDSNYQSTTGFPTTRAALFAYDCIVLSNIAPDAIEPEQMEQLALWIEGRGGGLVVTGTQSLESKHWLDTPLAALLPIQISPLQSTTPQPTPVIVTQRNHPIWRLRIEQTPNEQLLQALPPLTLGVSGVEAKPSAEVLVTTGDDPSSSGLPIPVMVAHRAGRGRVLVSSADLGGSALASLAETWGPQPERVASKLWRNIVYWVTEGSSVGRRRLVSTADKRFYRPGEKVSINAIAYDESARKSQSYRIWALFEPTSLEDSSLYSPVLWPENVVRESGEVGPRVAWGEELPLTLDPVDGQYRLDLMLSEASGSGDNGMRIEMTAYEGNGASSSLDHGTQVDSTSLAIQVLSDPFEQQNPLPNRELLVRLASLSGGRVLEQPSDLADILKGRRESIGPPSQDSTPAWSRWWVWLTMLGLISAEWIWRRTSGLA